MWIRRCLSAGLLLTLAAPAVALGQAAALALVPQTSHAQNCEALLITHSHVKLTRQQKIELEYADAASGIVKDNWYWQTRRAARRLKRLSGEVCISFNVLPSGKVIKLHVVHSSGHLSLDRAAAKAIRKSSPLLPFPPKLHSKSLKLQFNFLYNLPKHASKHPHKHTPK